MKKILIIFILLLIIPLTLARQSFIISNNQVRVDLVSYSPSPLTIGSPATIEFEIFNVGTGVIRNFKIIAVDKFPVEITSNPEVNILELRSSESYKFNFKVKVASNVPESTYQIGLQYYDEANDRVESITFEIPVKRVKRTVASTSITTDPEYISPGSTAFINVEIENNADFAMKDIEVKINFSGNVPLAPYKTTSQKQIDYIEAKSSEVATFQVIALPDAEPNVYILPLHIIFDDELGNENTRQDYIGIIISKTPEYDITVEDSTPIKGIKDTITISLSNIGPSNIRYLIMEILPSKYYNILTSPRTYIGNLEPDDYETADFDIIPQKSGTIPIKVKLEYKDDLNNPTSEIKEAQVYVYSTMRAKSMGLIPSNTTRNIILLLFVIFVYFTYKAWRSTRNISLSMKQSVLRMLTFAANLIRHIRWGYIKRIPRKIRIFFIKLR